MTPGSSVDVGCRRMVDFPLCVVKESRIGTIGATMGRTTTLHLISGLPCAGKTTYAERLRAERNAVHFALDRWLITCFGRYVVDGVGYAEHLRRVYACRELIWSVAVELLRRKADVILDDGFFLRRDRRYYVSLAHDSGANAAIHFIDTPAAVLRARLADRNIDRKSVV